MGTFKLGCIGMAVALCACTSDKHEDKNFVPGAVSVALTSAGSDGTLFYLPPSTRLSLVMESANQLPNYDVSLDGDSDVVTFSAAAGNYQAQIYNTDVDYTINWPLTRIANGMSETVDTTLLTPQPTSIAVQSGQTTPLVLQFAITGGGILTFDHGNVAVSVDVGAQPASSFSFALQGSGDVLNTPTITGPFAAQLTAVMPAVGATGLQISVSANLTGSFQEAGGSIDADGSLFSVCAPIEIVGSSASGNDGFAAVIAESGHGSAPEFLFGPAVLCIQDDGTTNEVRIRMSRDGTAETQTFADIFGSDSVLFWNVIRGTLPTRVYDGQAGTLNFDALIGNHSLPMRVVNRIGADALNLWYIGTVVGQMDFSFVGQP